MALEDFQVIVNPNAAGGRGHRIVRRLEEELLSLGGRVPILRTRGPGHARDLASEASESGVERLLVVGGDGTVHEVANGILAGDEDARPALAVVPVGTGNDFFRMVRSPGGVGNGLRLIREGVPRRFDVGEALWDGRRCYFVNVAGVGVDVEVLRRRSSFRWLSGVGQYLAALSSALVRFRCLRLAVEATPERSRIDAHILLAAVTVGPSVGGGFLVAPDAEPDDGLLDLFVVERLSLLRVMRYLPSVLRGTIRGGREIHIGQATGLRLRSPEGRPFQFELDGELMPGETAELEIRVRSACLPVLELPERSG